MRQLFLLGPVVGTILVALVTLGPRPGILAQAGTPAVALAFVGVTPESLAIGMIPGLPPGSRVITLSRLRFAPGGYARNAASDPALALVSIEAGTITVRSTAPVSVNRAATPGEPATAQFPAGAEITQQAGDSFIAPLAGGEVRNAGPGSATLLVAGLGPLATATPRP